MKTASIPGRPPVALNDHARLFPPETTAAKADYRPGDFLLTHGDATVDHLIQFGQRLRYDKAYCWFNHAVLVVGEAGDTVEAQAQGVIRSHIDHYAPGEYAIVNSGLSDADRADAARFGQGMVGVPYGWVTDVSIGLTFLTGDTLRFSTGGTVICSGLVAAALSLDEFRVDPSHVPPAGLARHYDIRPPAQLIAA
ncbi:MAG: hypothetical protein ACRDXE_11040 [Acidimicrobiales bacterium]